MVNDLRRRLESNKIDVNTSGDQVSALGLDKEQKNLTIIVLDDK